MLHLNTTMKKHSLTDKLNVWMGYRASMHLNPDRGFGP